MCKQVGSNPCVGPISGLQKSVKKNEARKTVQKCNSLWKGINHGIYAGD
jgi:hypothetical protein